MAIVLILVGAFVYLRVAEELSSTIDDSLRTRVDELAHQLQGAAPSEIRLSGPEAEGAEDILTEVVRSDGMVVASSEAVQGSEPVLSPSELAQAREGLTFFSARAVPGVEGEARLLARPVETAEGKVIAVTGASTGDRAETLSSLAATFAVGGSLALLVASALGYGLAALAMRPVEAMRTRAGRITLERTGERLPLPKTDDEIGRLGATLNQMLARIENSIERQRSFVADASHELRTPLAILRGELELGLRQERSREEARAAMRSAIEEADRLQRLADDLLTLARADAAQLPLELKEVAVAELLERTRRRFAGRAAEEGRSITIDAEAALRWPLDSARIEAAVGNLVENALRHGAGAVGLSAERQGRELAITVVDEGPGFPPNFAAQAFERFARAESSRTSSGAGLGLAIVRANAQAHGGRVSIEERVDGAAVVLHLPDRRVPAADAEAGA